MKLIIIKINLINFFLSIVPPMIRIENQLVGAYDGQTLILECNSEAYPKPITYWTTPSNETINNGNLLNSNKLSV
jgi:hypothetical protein